MKVYVRSGKGYNYTSKKKPTAQGWVVQSWVEINPGLVQNFISDLKALEEKSVQFSFFNVVIKCSEENRYNYPKQALEQRNWRNLRFVLKKPPPHSSPKLHAGAHKLKPPVLT